MLCAAGKVIPKSEPDITDEELTLGPEIAGRILGVAPLWNDDTVQKHVNLIGRWEASQTSRPDLPWASVLSTAVRTMRLPRRAATSW